MEYNIMDLQEKVKMNMTPKRFFHTLGVQYTSTSLAMRYQCDIKKAEVAGLLHDYAKCNSEEEMISKCTEYQIEISDFEKKSPYLLHTKLGAYYAKTRFHIFDQEVLDAITFHTTGRPNMTLLDKIVFVADYIEPSRRIIPGLDTIRKAAFEDIDYTTFLILDNTLNYLKRDAAKEIDPMTVYAHDFYKDYAI